MTPFRSLSTPEQRGETARIVAEYGVDTTLLQGAIDNIADVLEDDEVLIAMATGRLERPLVKGLVDLGLGDMTPRLLALTERRLIGIRKRALRPVDETSILLSTVEDVHGKIGVFQGSISIRADGRNYLIGGMSKRSIDRFVHQIELAIQTRRQQAVTDTANAPETEERLTSSDDAQLPNESPSDSDDESQTQAAPPASAPQPEGTVTSDTDRTVESAQTSPAHDPVSRMDGITDEAADFRAGLDMADAETVTQHAKTYVISERIVRPRIPSLLHALRPDEEVMFFTTGVDANKTVLIALTDRRIVLSDKDPQRTNAVDLVGLSAISGQTGLVQGGIFVDFDGHHRKFGSVPIKTVEPFVSLAKDAAAALEMQARSQLGRSGESTGTPTQTVEATRTVTPFTPIAIKGLGTQDRTDVYRRLAFEIGDDGFMTRGELDHLPAVMMPDELLLWFASGALQSTGKEQRLGGFTLIALTDRRILLLDKKLLAGIQTIAIDLDRVNSITGDTGLLFGNVKIQDGGDERKIGLIKNDTVQPFVDRVQEAIQQRKQRLHDQQAAAIAEASAPTAAAAPVINVADELEKLASLMERGILTPEEFAQQKAKLLQG